MTFADTLRRLRIARNLTQLELAERANVRALQICRYELGKSQPMLDVLQRLCHALGCSADELLFGGETQATQALPAQLTTITQLPPEAQQHINQTLTALIGWYQAKR